MPGLGYARMRLVDEIVQQNYGADPKTRQFTYQDLLYIIQEMIDAEGKKYFDDQLTPTAGYSRFKELVKVFLYRNLANYDSMVLFTGQKGVGKSSDALVTAREWCSLMGIKFDVKKHIAYNNSEVLEKVDSLPPFSPLICDESVRFAQASEWAKKEHKELKKRLAQVRTKHLLYLMCFPLKVQKVEKNYLESFTNYFIDIIGRGTGIAYVKDLNPMQDSWRINEFKNVGSYNEFTPIEQVEEKVKRHPNFWQVIRFPKPPQWLYQRYLKIREANVYGEDVVWEATTKEDIQTACLLLTLNDVMTHDNSLSVNRIMSYIKSEYDIPLTKTAITLRFEDARQLIMKIRENTIQGEELDKLEDGPRAAQEEG